MSTITTNFGITLPEGTDTFNPLIYNNDAFTLIDSIMKSIKNATIGSANQVLSDNINIITRIDSKTNAFVFIASSDYNATHAFYVDDLPVNVRYSDGSAPKNGAYRTNQAVLCYLNGNILTLFINNRELLSALDITYDNSNSTLQSTNVQNAIDNLSSKKGNIVTQNIVLSDQTFPSGQSSHAVDISSIDRDKYDIISMIPVLSNNSNWISLSVHHPSSWIVGAYNHYSSELNFDITVTVILRIK